MAECPYKHGDTIWCVSTLSTTVHNGYCEDTRPSVFIRYGTFVGVVADDDKTHMPGDYLVTGLNDNITAVSPQRAYRRQEEASLAAFRMHLKFLEDDEDSIKEQYKYLSNCLKSKRSEIQQFKKLVSQLEGKLKGKED